MGEIESEERRREFQMDKDNLASDPSASESFDILEVDICSSDKADSKLGFSKKFLSNSDGDEYSKLFISTVGLIKNVG